VPDHSIDTYISYETIEHIQPGEVPQYFAEVKRVLRPGGRFLCSSPIYRGDQFGLGMVDAHRLGAGGGRTAAGA
jgi:cyclopropane fatty-acyl-phospholipid synthase-like methyltransferase